MNSSQSRINWGMFLLGLIVIALGISIIIVNAGEAIYNSFYSLAWPSTNGRVIRSGVLVEQGDAQHPGNHYRAQVEYQYMVGNQQLTGGTVYFGCCIGGQAQQEAIVQRYPSNGRVAVYYDPNDPINSVLEKGFNFEALSTWLLFGTGIILAGFLCLEKGKRKTVA